MKNDNDTEFFASYQREAVEDMAKLRSETITALRRHGHDYAATLVEEHVADLESLFQQSIIPRNGRPNWELVVRFADQMAELHKGIGAVLRGQNG